MSLKGKERAAAYPRDRYDDEEGEEDGYETEGNGKKVKSEEAGNEQDVYEKLEEDAEAGAGQGAAILTVHREKAKMITANHSNLDSKTCSRTTSSTNKGRTGSRISSP